MRIFCPAMVVGRPSLPAASVRVSGVGTHEEPGVVSLVVAPVHEVGRVAPGPHTGPRATCVPLGGSCAQGLSVGAAHSDTRSWDLGPGAPQPYAQPVKDATRECGALDRGVLLVDLG